MTATEAALTPASDSYIHVCTTELHRFKHIADVSVDREFLSWVHHYQQECERMIEEVEECLEFLTVLKTDYVHVATKTNALHEACENLLEDQVTGSGCHHHHKWQTLLSSAVMVSIFGFAVGFDRFLIKTAVYGRFRFLWFQMLIKHTANSENQRMDNYRISILSESILGVSYRL